MLAAASVLVSILMGLCAEAASPDCARQVWKGEAPRLLNPKLAAKTRQICYSGYAVLHSGVTRTPLWSAEHLTRERVETARPLPRVNSFHPDPNLPPDQRAEVADYARTGFDRGHMAPSGDMPDPQSQDESFSLANVIPQDPEDNRVLWEAIESAVRDLTVRDGELYVVTGPVFEGENLESLNGRVLVPTQVYKAVYDPARNQAAAYLAQNTHGTAWQTLSMTDLQKLAGIDPFPALPPDAKKVAMDLPKPFWRPRRPNGRRNLDPTETSSTRRNDFVSEMLKAIDRIGKP